MRLLIQGLNYRPDEIGISKYTSELAEWFAARGWSVLAVTAPPYYPAWSHHKGYTRRRYKKERIAGVDVIRCPLYVPGNPSGARRIAHLSSYALSSFPVVFGAAASLRPDIVFSVAPALFAAGATALAAKVARAASWLHVQDFEVDAAFELGLLSKPRLRAGAERFENKVLHAFDHVSSPSPKMVDRLLGKGCLRSATSELRNWADVETINPSVDGTAWRTSLGVSDKTVVLYSGNMAAKQGLDILVQAAARVQNRSDLVFLLCGHGPGKAQLIESSRGLSNVIHLPLQPAEALPQLLAAADIHVLPQRAEAEDLVLPSKLSGMLASGRPVVATVRPDSGVASEIAGAGEVVPPGDSDALARAIESLAENPKLRRAYGIAARRHAESRWNRDTILEDLERRFLSLITGKRARGRIDPAVSVPNAPSR